MVIKVGEKENWVVGIDEIRDSREVTVKSAAMFL